MNIEYLNIEHGINFLKEDENKRSINIYTLNECILDGVNLNYPNSLIYTKETQKLYLPVNEQTMSLKSQTIYHTQGLKYECDNTIHKEYENPVFFFIYNVENYYHFLYDSIPNLISYFHLKKSNSNLKILINYPPDKQEFYKFIIEFFDILGVTNDLVIVEKNTEYKKIYITDSYTHNGMSNVSPRKEIFDFYKLIVTLALQKEKEIKTKTYDCIYISRRTWIHEDYSNIGTNYTTRRKLVNEDELVTSLGNMGVKEIFTENLSMIEKIVLFNKAKFIIGPIGGGLANVVFSNPSTKLIALISPTFLTVNQRFKFSLDCVNVLYFHNTNHIEHGNFKTYMRVKTDADIIGEIVEVYEDELLISYCESKSNVGWNFEKEYKKTKISKSNAIKLDDGLNSPWIINLDKLFHSEFFILPIN